MGAYIAFTGTCHLIGEYVFFPLCPAEQGTYFQASLLLKQARHVLDIGYTSTMFSWISKKSKIEDIYLKSMY